MTIYSTLVTIINESSIKFKNIKDIINNIPKDEHHYFYNGAEFKKSPFMVYRDIEYMRDSNGKKHGAFIEIYAITDPCVGIVVIACEPSVRGTGVTVTLVDRAKENMAKCGLTSLYWKTDVDNISSQKLAEKCGFKKDQQESTKKKVVYKYFINDNQE